MPSLPETPHDEKRQPAFPWLGMTLKKPDQPRNSGVAVFRAADILTVSPLKINTQRLPWRRSDTSKPIKSAPDTMGALYSGTVTICYLSGSFYAFTALNTVKMSLFVTGATEIVSGTPK